MTTTEQAIQNLQRQITDLQRQLSMKRLHDLMRLQLQVRLAVMDTALQLIKDRINNPAWGYDHLSVSTMLDDAEAILARRAAGL